MPTICASTSSRRCATASGWRVLNLLGPDSGAIVELTVYQNLPVLSSRDLEWWPLWDGWQTLERLLLSGGAILDVLDDPRWRTHRVRALNFQLEPPVRCATAAGTIPAIDWIVDFTDQNLAAHS